ncbi:MAG: nuclear transport factor 2 family protein [Actinobacteria bacterium]|nr:nuclear transport factor 2 family protein [Actinomycetota bacterium]
MLSWLAGKMIARSMKAIREGDMAPTAALYADDVKFRFPGKNSFAPGAEGKAALEEWLGRFIRLGLQIYPDEVALTGWPWRQTISVRGHVHLDDPQDGRVYENRYVIWGHMRWGKMREYEVYEDTERTQALDAWLERTGKEAGPSPR